MWEKRRGLTPHAEVLFPSGPVSQYICMKLAKTDDNDRAHKNDANILTYGQCFYPYKYLIGDDSMTSDPSFHINHLRIS